MTKSTKLTNIVKTLIVIAANISIAILGLMSILSLIILIGQFDLSSILPEGAVQTFSAYDAWGGVNTYVLTFVLGNALMIFGLLKLKAFVKAFAMTELFADKTITFLKKGAILMTLVGLIQAITEFTFNSNHIILNFSLAGWLFIASLVLSYIKRHFINKTA